MNECKIVVELLKDSFATLNGKTSCMFSHRMVFITFLTNTSCFIFSIVSFIL